MKKTLQSFVLTASLLLMGAGFAQAGAQVGLSIGPGGLESFFLAIGNYYRVPQQRVVVVREARIPDEEVPVVFFIADRARVTPEAVIHYRRPGRSWMQVALHFGIGPDAFYYYVANPTGPYVATYRVYNSTRRADWGRIRLSDAEVVNLVNLRFLSEHYRCAPDRVVTWRNQGGHFDRFDNRNSRPAQGRTVSQPKPGNPGHSQTVSQPKPGNQGRGQTVSQPRSGNNQAKTTANHNQGKPERGQVASNNKGGNSRSRR